MATITVDELLATARILMIRADPDGVPGYALDVVQGFLDLLGEDKPCGAVELPIKQHLDGEFAIELDAALHSPSEIRALCAMYLRTADQVDAMNARRT